MKMRILEMRSSTVKSGIVLICGEHKSCIISRNLSTGDGFSQGKGDDYRMRVNFPL